MVVSRYIEGCYGRVVGRVGFSSIIVVVKDRRWIGYYFTGIGIFCKLRG